VPVPSVEVLAESLHDAVVLGLKAMNVPTRKLAINVETKGPLCIGRSLERR